MMGKKETNKIIETQEILFKEMKKIEALEDLDAKETKTEFDRAVALYNMSTNFIKSINTNIAIMNLSRKTDTKYDSLMKKLGI